MTKPISLLRQRMIDDMTIRNLSPSTQRNYIRAVAKFSAFHGQPPDKLGIEEIRAYRLQRGLMAASLYPIIGALRFFYGVTLGQKDMLEQIPYDPISDGATRPHARRYGADPRHAEPRQRGAARQENVEHGNGAAPACPVPRSRRSSHSAAQTWAA